MRGYRLKKLTQIGNSFGLIIPKPFLEAMGINPVLDKIEVELENKVLKIKKADKTNS